MGTMPTYSKQLMTQIPYIDDFYTTFEGLKSIIGELGNKNMP